MSDDSYGDGRRFTRGRGRDFGSEGRRDGGRGRGSARGRSNDYEDSRGNYSDSRNKQDDSDYNTGYDRGSSYTGGKHGNYNSSDRHENDDNDENSDNDYGTNIGRGSGGRFASKNSSNEDNYGDDKKSSYGRGLDRSGRGGDRGGRGGGGRGGFNRRGGGSNNGDFGSGSRRRSEGDDDDGSPPRGGRGGGGADRGRRNYDEDGNNSEKNGDGKDEKPKERYIPPEPTDDEATMFGSGITSGINFSKYENIRVKVSGDNPVEPISSFEDAGLRDLLYKNVEKSKYEVPTPIQKYAIPTIMSGRDLMACAQTGSGKTAAYLIPIVNTLLDNPSELVITSNSTEPQAIIMSPTRELTIQIFNEARKFAHGSILKVAMAYGGTATFYQASIIMKGCHILVATPGRLNDFVSRGRITFASVRFFVLDEADRMLDMGFKPEIEKMLHHSSMVAVGERQTMLFSATFPETIQRLALHYLHDYLFVAVGIVGGACADVEQVVYPVARFDKKEKLKEILSESQGNDKTLVFVEQKRTADFIAALLSENGFPTTSIHGDRLQSQREMALYDFKTGRMPTLVATAVAARGLDIKNVGHVINYDLPSSIEEYVHRIGRTGRVGNRGKATSFYDSNQDAALSSSLITILQQTNQQVPDFLSSDGYLAANKDYGNENNEDDFGGRDVRRNQSAKNFSGKQNLPVSQECEEEW